MTTETKTENTATPAVSDNRAMFGPLGKYAVIAVIMVSIIVTTAIMLDKQLSTAGEKIAVIKSDVIKSAAKETSVTEVTASTGTEAEAISVVASANDKPQIVDTAAKPGVSIETLSAEALVTTEAEVSSQTVTASGSNDNTQQETPETEIIAKADMVKSETVATENTKHTGQAQFAMTNMDKANVEQKMPSRKDVFKLTQKQRMTDMFARIKALESQRLDQYKTNQEKQIARLRGQVAMQQQMIEALVLRKNELFELRAASVQRNQAKREQMLNRI